MPEKISLDQIMSERAFSVRRTAAGAEGLTKLYKAPASWDPEGRSAKFVMTAEIVDRYGDIVVTKGGNIDEFVKNPVALWAHNARDFPIGMWSDIVKISGSPKRMEGKVNLTPEDTTENADTVAKLLAAGMVRACSIGFMPTAWDSIKDDKDHFTGYKFLEWELLECSICSVPANPAAIVKAAGGDEGLALQAIDLVLDEWARTPEGLIVPRAEYERTHSILKDKDVTLHEVRSIEAEELVPDAINALDFAAAVEAGIAKALGSDTLMGKIRELFGLKAKDPEPMDPVIRADPPAPEDVDEGETEEAFQARIKAAEPDLADEAEEEALRARAAEHA